MMVCKLYWLIVYGGSSVVGVKSDSDSKKGSSNCCLESIDFVLDLLLLWQPLDTKSNSYTSE